jgi:hypothetical protein
MSVKSISESTLPQKHECDQRSAKKAKNVAMVAARKKKTHQIKGKIQYDSRITHRQAEQRFYNGTVS